MKMAHITYILVHYLHVFSQFTKLKLSTFTFEPSFHSCRSSPDNTSLNPLFYFVMQKLLNFYLTWSSFRRICDKNKKNPKKLHLHFENTTRKFISHVIQFLLERILCRAVFSYYDYWHSVTISLLLVSQKEESYYVFCNGGKQYTLWSVPHDAILFCF